MAVIVPNFQLEECIKFPIELLDEFPRAVGIAGGITGCIAVGGKVGEFVWIGMKVEYLKCVASLQLFHGPRLMVFGRREVASEFVPVSDDGSHQAALGKVTAGHLIRQPHATSEIELAVHKHDAVEHEQSGVSSGGQAAAADSSAEVVPDLGFFSSQRLARRKGNNRWQQVNL